jgi:hypothetical protein
MQRLLNLVLLTTSAAGWLTAQTAPAVLYFQPGDARVAFAASEIRRALAEQGVSLVERTLQEAGETVAGSRFILVAGTPNNARLAIQLKLAPPVSGAPQSYDTRRQGTTYVVLGADAAGAMYGGLDLAEAIRLKSLPEWKDAAHSPHIAQRGIKFNIPLDARTPSYSDAGDAAQHNIPEMWSFDFWREFLDDMARHRFNVLSLWNLHPFPSMVKVPEYPDIALDDVMRTTVKLDDTFSFRGEDMVRPAMLQRLETVRKMSIGEKIAFWRDVMQYAQDRGISVYLFTWNVFVFGAEGKHGITPAMDNPATIDYFRRSVRETVLTYPLLAGIGVTAGEQMPVKEASAKEQWLWKAYGEGIREAKRLQPGREIRLIHRFHESSLQPILDAWKDYPGPFDLSYKYSVAHMYSTPAPIFARETLRILPPNLRLWMTVRNDDIYSFRWGDAEYARAYVRNLPGPDKLAGFYMGPDGYIWGREFISTEPDAPRETIIRKQWLSFMMWGRLSYEPSLPNTLFERALAVRFPEAPSAKIYAASAAASRIIPQITRFFWGDIDLKWFPEASLSHPRHRGFYTVRHFMEGNAMPGTGILNIREYCEGLLASRPMDGISPLQVAEALRNDARTTLQLISELRPATSKELRLTLGDYEAMAHLGNYYSEKIRGAVDLALFHRTGKPDHRESALAHLRIALDEWKKYAAVATAQYKPQLLTRVGYVDLNALTAKVEQDIDIAHRWQPAR